MCWTCKWQMRFGQSRPIIYFSDIYLLTIHSLLNLQRGDLVFTTVSCPSISCSTSHWAINAYPSIRQRQPIQLLGRRIIISNCHGHATTEIMSRIYYRICNDWGRLLVVSVVISSYRIKWMNRRDACVVREDKWPFIGQREFTRLTSFKRYLISIVIISAIH